MTTAARGLPLPVLRVPPTPAARARSIADATDRATLVLRDLDFPAAPWQILLAVQLYGEERCPSTIFTGLKRTTYASAVEVVEDLAAGSALIDVLLHAQRAHV